MSDQTPNREGLCVYCGTSRPVTKPICPQCGRTWIDTKVGEEIPALTPESVAASAIERTPPADLGESDAESADAAVAPIETSGQDTPDQDTPDQDTPNQDTPNQDTPNQDTPDQDTPAEPADRERRPLGLLIGAALAVVAVVAILFGVINQGGNEDAAPPSRTTSTVPDTTAETTTTTAATTTTTPPATTSTTTTTPVTTTTLAFIEPEGSAVPIEDLTLGAFALGPFGFNASTSYLGRLVATLGQPDSRVDAGTEYGLCEEDVGLAYTWGALTALFTVESDLEILVGYRLDDTGTDHPTQAITTRSGLKLGDTLERIDAIYLQSGLALEDIEEQPHFLLLRSSDDATLLWGPVTSKEQSGTIVGIYSPQSCDGGPRPST